MLSIRQVAARSYADGIRGVSRLPTRPRNFLASTVHARLALLPAPCIQVPSLQGARISRGYSSQRSRPSEEVIAEDQAHKHEVPADDQAPSTADATESSPTIIEQTAMLTDPSLTDAEKLATLTTELSSHPFCSKEALKFKARAEDAEAENAKLKSENEQLTRIMSRGMEYYKSMSEFQAAWDLAEECMSRREALLTYGLRGDSHGNGNNHGNQTLAAEKNSLGDEFSKPERNNEQPKTKLVDAMKQLSRQFSSRQARQISKLEASKQFLLKQLEQDHNEIGQLKSELLGFLSETLNVMRENDHLTADKAWIQDLKKRRRELVRQVWGE